MLNRRLLRVKVMQALYGYQQAERSIFQLSLDHISDTFSPDLNSMEPQDPGALEQKRAIASDLFRQTFDDQRPDLGKEPEEIRKAVHEAKQLFTERVKKDQKHYRKQLLNDVELINNTYLRTLLLILELIDFSEDDEEEEKKRLLKKEATIPLAVNLRQNKIYQIIKDDQQLEQLRIKNGLSWEREVVKRTYRNRLKTDADVIEYLRKNGTDIEEDRKILLHITKNIIFKDESLQALFEEEDFNWTENQSIVKSLVLKTIRSAVEGNDSLLVDISGNWEEDKEFYEQLYQGTLEREEYLEELIQKKVQNWDMERIAVTDSIILRMALTEMILFPSIPVKVTINEFIELSKTYSTPKSKQFINGLLDALSEELIEQGVIKKSGRGLIDNK